MRADHAEARAAARAWRAALARADPDAVRRAVEFGIAQMRSGAFPQIEALATRGDPRSRRVRGTADGPGPSSSAGSRRSSTAQRSGWAWPPAPFPRPRRAERLASAVPPVGARLTHPLDRPG
jgi:hypothetical protein